MSDIHYVPVPKYALAEVYAVLAKATGQHEPETEADEAGDAAGLVGLDVPEEDSVSVPDNGLWTFEEIEELAGKMKNPAGVAMINLIADKSLSDEWTYYQDLLEVGQKVSGPDFNFDQVRAQLSWFSKYSKKVKGSKVWPLQVDDRGPDEDKGHRYRYLMPELLAKVWLANAG